MVAVATALMILAGRDRREACKKRNSVTSAIWWTALAVYFVISIATGAWPVSWVIFPVTGCINGIVRAVFDLKEAKKNENQCNR